jgi:hypothetical protein
LRCGVGRCVWADGSTYEGEWENNKRHGNGKFNCEIFEYVGQWQQDMKHGRGKMTKRGEEPIFGPFENDKMNGLGVQDGKTILFKEGMAVTLEGQECSC